MRQERVRKFCGKFAEILGNLQKIFCDDPFPNDPMSELLTKAITDELPQVRSENLIQKRLPQIPKPRS